MKQLRVNGALSSIIYGQMERAMSTKQREEQREWRHMPNYHCSSIERERVEQA